MKLEDLRIRAIEPLYSPQQLKESLPVPAAVATTVLDVAHRYNVMPNALKAADAMTVVAPA